MKDKKTSPETPARQNPADGVQGEGNYDAARRFDKAEQDFVRSGKVREAAERAAPKTAEEAKALERAEEIGRSHAKDEDPDVRR